MGLHRPPDAWEKEPLVLLRRINPDRDRRYKGVAGKVGRGPDARPGDLLHLNATGGHGEHSGQAPEGATDTEPLDPGGSPGGMRLANAGGAAGVGEGGIILDIGGGAVRGTGWMERLGKEAYSVDGTEKAGQNCVFEAGNTGGPNENTTRFRRSIHKVGEDAVSNLASDELLVVGIGAVRETVGRSGAKNGNGSGERLEHVGKGSRDKMLDN